MGEDGRQKHCQHARWPKPALISLIIHVDLGTRTCFRHRGCPLSALSLPRRSLLPPRPARKVHGVRKRYGSLRGHHRAAYTRNRKFILPRNSLRECGTIVTCPRLSVSQSGVPIIDRVVGELPPPLPASECIGRTSARCAHHPGLRLAYAG